jgi:hypothetical protein
MGSAAVSFVSLFLSLTTGLHPVEVTVTGPVAAVEIRIDGETVAVMPRAPWKTNCDFGQLRPLVLEAVALDADDRECARARQLVNLPRQAVESSLVLERSEDGLPTSARLISASAMGLERVTVQLTLDGLPLEVEDPDHFNLPPCDLDEIHFLSARVDYAQGVISHAELSFSGRWAGEMSTDLTAVPVLRPRGVKHLDVGAAIVAEETSPHRNDDRRSNGPVSQGETTAHHEDNAGPPSQAPQAAPTVDDSPNTGAAPRFGRPLPAVPAGRSEP